MERILVVDDEPHVTRLVQQQLRREGYEVLTASHGLDALSKMESDGPFDAVITDYNMPKMDGRELCEAIRERYRGARIFIFLVTARLEQPLRSWAEGGPAIQFIEKPVSVRDLLARLAKCFAPEEGGDGEADTPLREGEHGDAER